MAEASTPKAPPKAAAATIFGAPISWVALLAAILAGCSVVPVIFYAEGGGYYSLAYTLMPIVGLMIGPFAGFVSGLAAGIIVMFIMPAAVAGGLPTAILEWGIPPLACGLIANRKWWVLVPFIVVWTIIGNVVPWYWPGPPTFPTPPQPFFALSGYWDYMGLVWLVVLGWKYIPEWVRSDSTVKVAVGLVFTQWAGIQSFHFGSWTIYSVLFGMPPDLVAFIQAFAVPWQRLITMSVTGIIGASVLMALKKSGLRRIPRAVW